MPQFSRSESKKALLPGKDRIFCVSPEMEGTAKASSAPLCGDRFHPDNIFISVIS
jgi:hypothetical protein